MWILIGGIVSVVLGAIGLAVWWWPFLSFLAGVIPVLLIIGGGIAIYFGIDELRYPIPKEEPSEEKVPEPSPAQPPHTAEDEKKERTFWLLSYNAKNIHVVQQTQRLAVPPDRVELITNEMKTGDHVVLYASAPTSKFAAIVEITGGPSEEDGLSFEPAKGEGQWRHFRPVSTVVMPPEERWVEASSILERLEFLKEAREKGRSLSHAFAAKLKGALRLTWADYESILQALGGS